MAEYIDKEVAIQICIDSWDTGEASQDIKHEPPANVVEKEKIYKALNEAYKIRIEVLNANECYEPNDVLDIIDQITKLFEEI